MPKNVFFFRCSVATILHKDPRLQLAFIVVELLATKAWKCAFYSLHIHACAQECTCTGTRARVTTRSCCTLCPLSVCISVPLLMSHIRIVLSRLHVMRRRLLNASASTASRWACNINSTKLPPPHVHTSQPPLLMVNTYSTVTFSRKYLRLDTQAEINLCRTYRTNTGSSQTKFPKSRNSRLNETVTFFSWEEAINYRRRKQPPSAGAPYHRNILKDNTRRRQKVPTTVIYEQKSF